ncbi:MAG: hypothetical protein ACXVBH_14855 [Flavisolibacter sp.]
MFIVRQNSVRLRQLYWLAALLFVSTNFCIAQQGKTTAPAESFDIKKASFLLPQPLPKGRYSQAISLVYVVLPRDWTLDVINAPTFCYEGKYTLPAGFNLQGSFNTLIVSNRFNLGPFWNYSFNDYHIGLGYQVGFSYGFLNKNAFGFNTKMNIWEQQPSVTIGHNFSKTALTIRGDLYYTSTINEIQGGHTITHHLSAVNGWSTSANFEQRLHKKKILYFGVKMNYLRYHFLAWPAFPVNQYRYWVPEIHIGFEPIKL